MSSREKEKDREMKKKKRGAKSRRSGVLDLPGSSLPLSDSASLSRDSFVLLGVFFGMKEIKLSLESQFESEFE